MSWRGWTLAASLAVCAGCSFDSSGDGGGSAGWGGDSDGTEGSSGPGNDTSDSTSGNSASGTSGSPTSDPTSDPSNPSDPTDPTDPTDPSDPTEDPSDPTEDPTESDTASSTGPGDPAMIEISGDDFGVMDYGTSESRQFTVTNVGEAPATGIASMVSGAFNLEESSCDDTLAPNASCGVRISHGADTLGPFEGVFTVDYDGGPATIDLSADVTGSTGNIVIDGGFESCPGDWVDAGPGTWVCGADWVTPHSGSGFLGADTGPNDQAYTARLDMNVSEFSNAIATGNMEFDFSGWARAADFGNDEYRFRVRYRNADGQAQSTYNSQWQTSGNWQEFTDVRFAPTDTVEIRIEVFCFKTGGDYCDAYYDDIVLLGRYDGAD